MKLEDIQSSSTTRIALMGMPGSGKSTLASKLANDGFRLHWCSLDNDSDILLKLPKESWPNVDYIEFPDSASFPVGADSMMKLFKNGKGSFCHTHGVDNCAYCRKNDPDKVSVIDFSEFEPKKDILVLDSGSQLGHSIYAHCLKDQPFEYKPDWDDWGIQRRWTEFFASQWQACRVNLIVIFHIVEAKMEDGRTKMVPSFGTREMSAKIGKAFSHIVYMDVMNMKHVAYSASTYSNNVLTKSRSDFMIEHLKEPSLAPIFWGHVPETMIKEPEPPKSQVSDEAATKGLEALKAKFGGLKK